MHSIKTEEVIIISFIFTSTILLCRISLNPYLLLFPVTDHFSGPLPVPEYHTVPVFLLPTMPDPPPWH